MEIKKSLIGKNLYVIDDNGKKYGPFKEINELSDVLSEIHKISFMEQPTDYKHIGYLVKNGKTGLLLGQSDGIHSSITINVPCIYDIIYPVNSKCIVELGEDCTTDFDHYENDKNFSDIEGFGVKTDGKWGFLDKNGKKILSCKFDEIICKGNLIFVKINNKFGIFSQDMEEDLVQYKYDEIKFCKDKILVKYNEKFGILDKNGNELVPCNYDDIVYDNNYFIVKENQKYGVLDDNGKEVIPFVYDEIIMNNKFFIVKKGQKYGVLDESGKEIIECKYDKIDFDNNVYIVLQNQKHGIIDQSGEILLDLKYDEIHYDETSKDIIHIKQNEKCGIVNNDGTQLIPCEYEEIKIINYSNVVFLVKQNGKWGMLDNKGKSLTHCVYDEIKIAYIGEGLYVRKDDKWGHIDKNANEIVPCEFSLEKIEFLIKVFDKCFHDQYFELFTLKVEDLENVQELIYLKNYLYYKIKNFIMNSTSKEGIDIAVKNFENKVKYIAEKIEFRLRKETVKKKTLDEIEKLYEDLFGSHNDETKNVQM